MGCAASRVNPDDSTASQLACQDAVRLILALPKQLRLPFDTFLASSPLYASATQGVAFADAVERAWDAVIRGLRPHWERPEFAPGDAST